MLSADEMAQQIKALEVELDDLNSVPQTHVAGENILQTCARVCTHTLMHIHTQTHT